MHRHSLAVLLAVFALVAAACGDDSGSDAVEEATTTTRTPASVATTAPGPTTTAAPTTAAPTTEAPAEPDDPGFVVHRVPEDFPTIQDAVDAAAPGELVLIGPGTYNEAVIVQTENLVIRGADRNEVILDGQHDGVSENGFQVFSPGVAIENMTITGYNSNAVFFTGGTYDGQGSFLQGYRASYITAYNNGDYGIYGFNAQYGLIEHSYASGHPDSGYYIGQCQPCHSVIRNVVSENNTLGYSGTNAGGELYVIESEWADNRVGIVPNSLESEALAPQAGATFVGNYVHDNGNTQTPRKNADWDLAFGVGIVTAGGLDNLVTRNLVVDNSFAGVAASFFPDGDTIWVAENNVISENVVSGSEFDLFLLVPNPDAGALGNCFENNTFETSKPADVETVAACGATGPVGEVSLPDLDPRPFVSHTEIEAPGPQESMPDAETAPPQPAVDHVPVIDVDAIEVPSA